jgi:hypothetical protein
MPLQILKGYTPTEPVKLSCLAKPKDAEGIYQGMAIVKDVNGEWVKAAAADATALNKSIYIARQDQDDHAVQNCGKLVGLDCSDKYEVQTGYVEDLSSGAWTVDQELTVGNGGLFVRAAVGDQVVGQVTAIGTGEDGRIDIGGLTRAASNTLVLQFKTVARFVKTA